MQVSEEVAKSIVAVLNKIAAESVKKGDTPPLVQHKVMSVVADNCSVMTNGMILSLSYQSVLAHVR